MDDTTTIQQTDIFPLSSKGEQQTHRRNTGSTGSKTDNLGICNLFTLEFKCIQQTGSSNRSRAVLIIMKDGDIKSFT